jgi:hypothetical protein
MTATLDLTRPRKPAIATWSLQRRLAPDFAAAARAKFTRVPMRAMTVQQIGLGQWLRYVTAMFKVIGVVAMLLPGFAGPGALWLGIALAFAILKHLLILHSNPGGAGILLALSVALVWLRREQFAALRARFV